MPPPDSFPGSAAFARLGRRLPSVADAHLWAVLVIPADGWVGGGQADTGCGGERSEKLESPRLFGYITVVGKKKTKEKDSPKSHSNIGMAEKNIQWKLA